MTNRGTSYEGKPPRTGSGERRVALVIGNGAYSHAAPLDNPVRDAEAMAVRLAKLGFHVVKGLDLDLRRIGDVQAAFEDKLRGKPEVALLFYAGHGLQVEGRNYLIPVDAEITQKAHLASRALLFNDLLGDMADNASASLIFLDACRDNPFTRNLARSLGDSARYAGVRGGLARIEKVAGTFIAYATAPDQVAFDGKGQNSPFTSALLQHIETPGLSVGDLMIDVRNKVLEETNGRQEPWDQSSLRARFYFVPPDAEPPRPASEAASEWTAIQGTTSLAVLAAFQERYPDPPWSGYAEARARELRAADTARQAAEEAEGQRVREAPYTFTTVYPGPYEVAEANALLAKAQAAREEKAGALHLQEVRTLSRLIDDPATSWKLLAVGIPFALACMVAGGFFGLRLRIEELLDGLASGLALGSLALLVLTVAVALRRYPEMEKYESAYLFLGASLWSFSSLPPLIQSICCNFFGLCQLFCPMGSCSDRIPSGEVNSSAPTDIGLVGVSVAVIFVAWLLRGNLKEEATGVALAATWLAVAMSINASYAGLYQLIYPLELGAAELMFNIGNLSRFAVSFVGIYLFARHRRVLSMGSTLVFILGILASVAMSWDVVSQLRNHIWSVGKAIVGPA